MKSFHQQSRSRMLAYHSNANRAAIFILALLVVHDISVAVTSRTGAAVIAQAYARPPAYVSRSTNRDKCISFAGKQSFITACGLRCGGIAKHNQVSLPRGDTSLFVTKSLNDTEVKNNNAKYHLIWSPNFWKKLLISTTIWFIIQYASKKNTPSLEKMLFSHDLPACHSEPITFNRFRRVFPTAVVLPLLSSSCCAIQLIINTLSGWGCAGFNTYLGPIRPILLPIMLLSTWKLLPHRSVGWTFLSLFLAFLPEFVNIWNTARSRQWQQNQIDDNHDVESSLSLSSYPVSAKLRLNCPTMGCVACVNKIDTSIRQCKSAASIREEISWLTDGSAKGGMAELLILAKTNEEIDMIAREVLAAVENAGFQCNVESLRVDER